MKTITCLTGTCLLLMFPLYLKAESISVTGNVFGEWDVDTVRVLSDIDIREGETLLVHPGVLIEFQGHFSFYVRGYIHALGESGQPVIFDVADTAGFSIDTIPGGGWKGVRFFYNSNADSSLFEHCIFRHGKAVGGDSLEQYGGALSLRYSGNVRISHCLFEDNFATFNGGAVYSEESSFSILHCDFISNRCGPATDPYGYGGAVCSDRSDLYLFGNYFEANSSTGVGGAVAIRFQDSRVHNNIFSGNYSALGGALGYLHYYEYPYSQCNNLIYGNSSAFFGGGIASIDAGPVFVNNTITGNTSIYGGGFYVKDSLIPQVYNSILWNNSAAVGPEVYLWDAFATADFYHCDVAGGPENFGGSGGGAGYTGIYEDNLDADPLFEDPSAADFHLAPGSPAQNSGTPDTTGLHLPDIDLDGALRVDAGPGIIDMGCYELHATAIARNGVLTGYIRVYPVPSASLVNIEFISLSSGQVSVDIYDRLGRVVHRLPEKVIKVGEMAEFQWDARSCGVPPGIFILIIRQDGVAVGSRKVMVD